MLKNLSHCLTIGIQSLEKQLASLTVRFLYSICVFKNHEQTLKIESISGSVNWKNHFLFFVVPAGLHVLINCILFVVTAIRCSRVKNEIHRMQSRVDESSTSTKRRKFIVSRAMFVYGASYIFWAHFCFVFNTSHNTIYKSKNFPIQINSS